MVFLDIFGRWLFWHRNKSIGKIREAAVSESARNKLGAIKRKRYEGVAAMAPEDRNAALLLAEESLDVALEHLTSSLGDEGTDCLFDDRYAYCFKISIEVVT